MTAKANKTDPVFQTFLVRELESGEREYYHKQFSEWYKLPEEWAEDVVWN